MTAIKISTQVLDAEELMAKVIEVSSQPNPVPSAALAEKSHWMHVVVKNQTQFSISPLSPPYLASGKYFTLPQEQKSFSHSVFAVCNRDRDPRGATGGTAFRLDIDNNTAYEVAVGWADPVVGAYKSSVVASSSPKDGYNAASPEGNSFESDNTYEANDSHGNAVRFRLRFSAMTADHLALIVVDQVRLPESPILFAHGEIAGKAGSLLIGTFEVDGIPTHFTGTCSPNLPDWSSDSAILEYSSVEALTASKTFYGKVGVDAGIELIVASGVRIRGQLTKNIPEASVVTGTGTWG